MKSRMKILRRILKPAWLYLIRHNLKPLSYNYGANRGEPVDRFFIEKFLEQNKDLIQGYCLEVESSVYTTKFGHNLNHTDVLDINQNNPKANIYADLRNLSAIEDNTYDCVILTQVLQFIDNYESAIKECHRILKTGGVLLVTLPFISRIDVRAGVSGDYWRFTKASAEFIFSKIFNKLKVQSWGNVRSGLAFWIGMSQEELSPKRLNYHDPNFPVIVTVKAIK